MHNFTKVIITFAAGATLLISIGAYANAASEQQFWTPSRIYSFLDNYYSGWQLPQMSSGMLKNCYYNKIPVDEGAPFLARGDFNGDGISDYAIGIIVNNDRHLLAFLSSSDGGSGDVFEVSTDYLGDLISVAPKGATYHNWETDSQGTFANDAIGIIWCGKGSTTFVYKNGSFKKLITGD